MRMCVLVTTHVCTHAPHHSLSVAALAHAHVRTRENTVLGLVDVSRCACMVSHSILSLFTVLLRSAFCVPAECRFSRPRTRTPSIREKRETRCRNPIETPRRQGSAKAQRMRRHAITVQAKVAPLTGVVLSQQVYWPCSRCTWPCGRNPSTRELPARCTISLTGVAAPFGTHCNRCGVLECSQANVDRMFVWGEQLVDSRETACSAASLSLRRRAVALGP